MLSFLEAFVEVVPAGLVGTVGWIFGSIFWVGDGLGLKKSGILRRNYKKQLCFWLLNRRFDLVFYFIRN